MGKVGAPKGSKNALGNKGGTGRPPLYRPEFAEQAKKVAMLGATDDDLAMFFEVTGKTIDVWKNKHPAFGQALREGKMVADAEVASKLYHRATGYEHPDTHISNYQGEITATPITKHYPPDTVAAIFWLKNRRRAQWRDRIDTEVTGKDGKDLVPAMDDMELARRIAFVLSSAAKGAT